MKLPPSNVSFSEILYTFPKTEFTKKAAVFFRYVNNVGLKKKQQKSQSTGKGVKKSKRINVRSDEKKRFHIKHVTSIIENLIIQLL